MSDSTTTIIGLTFNCSKSVLQLEINWLILVILILVVCFTVWALKIFSKRFHLKELEVEISGSPKAVFKAQRDDTSLFIANRINLELTTRKAALKFEEESDVIVEIYDSWYKVFQIIREEIKTVPGHYLQKHDPTDNLIGLTTNILNLGLRPHLTKYQAKFRKWFSMELKKEENKDKSPQDIQKKYSEYEALVKDLKNVNHILINYSDQLHQFIKRS